MSAVPMVAVRARGHLWRRTVAVFRMHFTDWITLVVLPAVVLTGVFAITLTVWTVSPGDGGEGWGEMSVYCFLTGIAALAVTRSLPFSLGMGSSRRAFVLGTLLTCLALAGGWGLVLFVLQCVERASGGWGQGAHFFWWTWYGRSAWPGVLLLEMSSLAAAFALGALVAALWLRWNRSALLFGGPAVTVVVGGASILVTYERWWGSVGDWVAGLSPLGVGAMCAVLLVVLTGLQYAVLRRVRG